VIPSGKEKPRVVIVGAGFGGLNTAKKLAKVPADVLLIDKNNHHLFQPLLYQVATAALSPADIAIPIRNVLRSQKNAEVRMAEVTGADLHRNLIFIGQESISFDFLIVATGAQYNYFAHPEWEKYAPGLKTLSDALSIREKILFAFESAEMEKNIDLQREWLTFVIVGGGPTGVEMAGALAELACKAIADDFRRIRPESTRIILIEAGPRLLSSFPEDLSQHAHEKLRQLGVEIRTYSTVKDLSEHRVTLGNETIKARTILWAAGVKVDSIGAWLGGETDRVGRVKVNSDLSLSEHPTVFVIGDAAYVQGADGNALPGVAPVAIQQGEYVASVIERKIRGEKTISPFRYINKGNLATIGRSAAVADFGWLRLKGFWAWLLWSLVHIYYLIGFRNRLLVFIQWAWAYVTFQRGARLITSTSRQNHESDT